MQPFNLMRDGRLSRSMAQRSLYRPVGTYWLPFPTLKAGGGSRRSDAFSSRRVAAQVKAVRHLPLRW